MIAIYGRGQCGGLFVSRLNSTADKNFGAGEGEEIEPGYFRTQGKTKRFLMKEP